MVTLTMALPVLLLLVLLQSDVNSGLLFNHRICYEPLGCFGNNAPFDNALREIPDSPENIQVKAYLWTRQNPSEGQELDYSNVQTIADSNFKPSRKTKFLIHGFLSNKNEPVETNVSAALLELGDFNVIGIAWADGAKQLYPKAVANTRVVGAVVAKLVETLQSHFDLVLSDLHVIGHSLGAHIAGYVGYRLPGIARITGLDPAGPMFTGTDPEVRLDPTDVVFVDAIHTDAAPLQDAGFGTLEPMGHQDYYPNGGQRQPGCPPPVKTTIEKLFEFSFANAFNDVSCAHSRSYWYFIASILETGCKFEAHPCQDWSKFQAGNCSSCGEGPCPTMGIDAIKTPDTRGSFYLKTNSRSPYCCRFNCYCF